MTVVSVDDFRVGVAESMQKQRGPWLAFAIGFGAVFGGAAFAEGHTQPVAVGIGLLLMGLAALAPYASRLRPIRSGPPIDPDSQLAEVEATVHNRIGQTDERIDQTDERIDALRQEMRERAALVDGFLATLEGGSQSVAISAANTRAGLRGPAA